VNLIIDENLPPRWCQYLAPFGIVATHWRDIGKIGDPDEVIFDYACEHRAVIMTQDLDFTRLLAMRRTQLPSVVQCRVLSPVPECIGASVIEILKTHQAKLLAGCLITFDGDHHRIRLLPLT
jgi:predicted nuclease of predicted toxin-antitoxin system